MLALAELTASILRLERLRVIVERRQCVGDVLKRVQHHQSIVRRWPDHRDRPPRGAWRAVFRPERSAASRRWQCSTRPSRSGTDCSTATLVADGPGERQLRQHVGGRHPDRRAGLMQRALLLSDVRALRDQGRWQTDRHFLRQFQIRQRQLDLPASCGNCPVRTASAMLGSPTVAAAPAVSREPTPGSIAAAARRRGCARPTRTAVQSCRSCFSSTAMISCVTSRSARAPMPVEWRWLRRWRSTSGSSPRAEGSGWSTCALQAFELASLGTEHIERVGNIDVGLVEIGDVPRKSRRNRCAADLRAFLIAYPCTCGANTPCCARALSRAGAARPAGPRCPDSSPSPARSAHRAVRPEQCPPLSRKITAYLEVLRLTTADLGHCGRSGSDPAT